MGRGLVLRLSTFALCMMLLNCGSSKQQLKQDPPEDLNELKARIDDLNNRVYVLTEQLETLKSQPPTTASAEQSAVKKHKKEPVKTETKAGSNQEKEYAEAYSLFSSGQYAKSLIAFSSFAEKYPTSALADNAVYWVGESYFQQKEYALAIDEYSKILKKFPKESKAPYAMYKLALCYKLLGENKDSEIYLQELLTRYPNSEAAKEANNNVEFKK